MSKLTKKLRARTRKVDYGHGDYGTQKDLECIEAADRIDKLEECLRELLDAQRNDADYVRFDAALEKARALLEEK